MERIDVRSMPSISAIRERWISAAKAVWEVRKDGRVIAAEVESLIDTVSQARAAVLHNHALDEAQQLADCSREEFKPEELILSKVSPVVGALPARRLWPSAAARNDHRPLK